MADMHFIRQDPETPRDLKQEGKTAIFTEYQFGLVARKAFCLFGKATYFQ